MAGATGVVPVGWLRRAACRSADPNLFFPPPGAFDAIAATQVEQAKALCAGCGVRRQCLQYAIDRDEEYGVWGGLTSDERRRASLRGRQRSGPSRRVL